MSFDPSSPQSRALALGLVAVVLIVLWSLAVAPIWAAFANQDEARVSAERLVHEYQRRSVPLATLQARLDALKQQHATEAGLIEAANPAVAGATLQTEIRRVIAAHGGMLRSVQPLPPSQEASYQKIAVRIDTTVPSNRLIDVLYDLEAAVPYLLAETFELRAPESPNAPKGAHGHPEVTLRADLYGYMRAATP